MESRFGHDFAHVQVHAGGDAARDAAALDARAYTVGSDIYFRDGAYAPETLEGAHLIAHELAHVVQQDRGDERTSAVSDFGDAAEVEARGAADAVIAGGEVSVTAPAGAAIARAGADDDSPVGMFSTISTLLGFPSKAGIMNLPSVAARPNDFMPSVADRLGFLSPLTGALGTMSSVDKALSGAADGDYLKAGSGLLGVGSGIGGIASWLGSDTRAAGAANPVGGVAGLLGAAGSAVDAYSNFSKGNYGAGALDTTKTVGGTLSGLATLGGFQLSSVAQMGAMEALAGGGAEGLAALGPAGAVIGAGLAGAGVGTLLSEHTSVGEHSVDSIGWVDELLTGDGERSFLLEQSENFGENWDKGEYLDMVGNGLAMGGAGLLGAVGGLAGGAADLAGSVGSGIGSVWDDIWD